MVVGIKGVLFFAVALRIVLLVYSIWHDASFPVKYTDIDYFVFKDASQFVYNKVSPYARKTYRYTPLLAFALLPSLQWDLFGKVLFCLCDLLAGYLVYALLRLQKIGPERAALFASFWLINPFVAVISTRGNAESILAVFVLATVYLLLKQRVILAAVIFGLSVHFKVYPVIYAVPIVLFLGEQKGFKGWKKVFNMNGIIFGVFSFTVFFSLSILMYR
ncbi:hypothetical protein HK096_010881, partial [Nowakowskiella sp. JEL0078]